ncbi:MAG: sn-glycerol-1-phosphate dehydrogenase [Spirochaetota bacterium]
MDRNKLSAVLERVPDTKELIIGSGVIQKIVEIFKTLFPGKSAVVVADDITYSVAGKEIDTALKAAGLQAGKAFIFPGTPMLHADYHHVRELREYLAANVSIPIAVGSGTINDIVKRGAFEAGRRYIIAATAASVDGYSGFGASIVKDGFKQTLECSAPLGIIADLDVLKKAPKEMTSAGYADLASKLTAGADWITADALELDKIVKPVWDIVQKDLRLWLDEPDKLAKGCDQQFEYLFEGLTMTGFSLQILKRTRSVSGCEHLFSHVLEMQDLQIKGVPVSHGFKVAVGTLLGTALYETLFLKEADQLEPEKIIKCWKPWEEREKEIINTFKGTLIVESVLNESKKKYLSLPELEKRVERVKSIWDDLRKEISKQLIRYKDLKEMFLSAGCPIKPGKINLTKKEVREAVIKAQMIRNRYTVLDLAFELGLLYEAIDAILDSDQYLN